MSYNLFKKVLVTLAFIIVYKSLSFIPIPLLGIQTLDNNSLLQLSNTLSGQSKNICNLISLGILPYILSFIMLEVISFSSPKIQKLKQTNEGTIKYVRYTKLLTILIALIESISLIFSINIEPNNISFFVTPFILVAGTFILIWISEQITAYGLGNGLSILILVSIFTSVFPFLSNLKDIIIDNGFTFSLVCVFFIFLLTIFIIFFVETSLRKIPLSFLYSSKKSNFNYYPLKINLAGIIPTIFASSILIIEHKILINYSDYIPNNISYILGETGLFNLFITFGLILLFSYSYISLTYDPKKIADKLNKEGSYIKNIKATENTEQYFRKTLNNLSHIGSFYIAFITTIPSFIIHKLGFPFPFAGAMVLITIQIALDIIRKLKSTILVDKVNNCSL